MLRNSLDLALDLTQETPLIPVLLGQDGQGALAPSIPKPFPKPKEIVPDSESSSIRITLLSVASQICS